MFGQDVGRHAGGARDCIDHAGGHRCHGDHPCCQGDAGGGRVDGGDDLVGGAGHRRWGGGQGGLAWKQKPVVTVTRLVTVTRVTSTLGCNLGWLVAR